MLLVEFTCTCSSALQLQVVHLLAHHCSPINLPQSKLSVATFYNNCLSQTDMTVNQRAMKVLMEAFKHIDNDECICAPPSNSISQLLTIASFAHRKLLKSWEKRRLKRHIRTLIFFLRLILEHVHA